MQQFDYTFRGKSMEELKELSIKEFAQLLPARQKRTLMRGLTEEQKRFMIKLGKKSKVRTHCRDMIVLPQMIGKNIMIHNGKEYVNLMIIDEMIGHRFGEFVMTRKRVGHNAPGVGATRSSASVSVR